jgi:hypothetical protein
MLGKFVAAVIVFISRYFYWISSPFNSVLLRLDTEGITELRSCSKLTSTLYSDVRCGFQMYVNYNNNNTVVPHVSAGDTFQDLPRMPETADSSEPYV